MTVSAEFIGGPWDGQVRQLEAAPWQLRVVVPAVSWLGERPPEPLGLARELVYRLVAPRFGVTSPVRYVLERVGR